MKNMNVKREVASWGATEKNLRALKKYANALFEDPAAMAYLPIRLRELIADIAFAEIPAPPPTKTGAPKKDLARKVARFTAEHFFGLTGNRPTRVVKDGKPYGPFIDFLGKVYKILNIKASAESQAKEAIEFVNKKFAKN
ncbi:MAG: hypothetical protein QOD74_1176 [Variibacter sp.]|nr:hypothetical protein [Variibacter sp.]